MRTHLYHSMVAAALVTGLLCAHTARAALASADTPGASTVLDEVVVKGTRLWKLRAAVIEAEDRLVERYNDLNQNDDFDIQCLLDAPTGTRLLRRYCMTQLQGRVERTDATAYINWSNDTVIDPVTGGARHSNSPTPMREVHLRLLERSQDYKKNLILLLQNNPDLRALAKQHSEARRRYEAAVKGIFGQSKSKPTR